MRAARAVTNFGPGAAALEYLDEDKHKPVWRRKQEPEDDGDEHQAKRQACLARLRALVGTQIQVSKLSLSHPQHVGLDQP